MLNLGTKMKKIFVPIGVVLVVLIAYFSYQQTRDVDTVLAPTPVPSAEPSNGKEVTNNPTPFPENWETYTNDEYGISFPYPPEYSLTENSSGATQYYIALQSPLDPEKPQKQTTLGENELKIEIVIEESVENDTSEKCYYDHTEEPNVISQEEVSVAGVTATSFTWEGIGTGVFTCVIKNDYRYLINKYPHESSLDSDYENIMEALTITSE